MVALNGFGGTDFTIGTANTGMCLPLNCNDSGSSSGTSIDFQQVFDSGLFAGPVLINSVSFIDQLLPGILGAPGVPLLSGTYTIRFAITNNAVGALSTTLASNITSGLVVFLTVNSPNLPDLSAAPLTFSGSSPFLYDPSLGNLLMEIIVSSQENINSSSYSPANGMDADDTNSVMSSAYEVTGSTAVVNGPALVTTINFDNAILVPEPSTWALMGAGLLALLARTRRSARTAALCSGIAAAALALAAGSPASAQTTPVLRGRTIAIPMHPAPGTAPISTSSTPPETHLRQSAATPAASPATIPKFARTFATNPAITATFVGTDPKTSNVTTTINVPVIPVIVVMSDNTTFDPTKRLNTAPAGSALSALLATVTSPIFQNATYTADRITVGTGIQFGDAIQRATFWDSVGSTSPNWHVKLSYQVKPAITVRPPSNLGSQTAVNGVPFGQVDIDWLGALLDTASLSYPAESFPVFLLYNVTMGCCTLGYHTAVTEPGKIHTYSVSGYFDPGLLGAAVADVSVLSHEVSEWLNDPFVDNIVPAWPAPFSFVPPGPPYDNTNCQTNLETGDPLEDRDAAKGTFKITTFGRQYMLANQALAPWFLRTASFSVNGWYTFLGPVDGEFTGPAPLCGAI